MLAFVGFKDWEEQLLRKVAVEIDVAERCVFLPDADAVSDPGQLPQPSTGRQTYPGVIFLSTDGGSDVWPRTLEMLRNHTVLHGVPIVGLGNLSEEERVMAYGMRISSVIPKPGDYNTMVAYAKTALDYWLRMVQLPQKYLG